jgi:FMN-dependent NADH-azoreductase
MKLLHIDSSILGANSVSREVAAAVVDRLRKSGAQVEVTYRDLAANPLPHITPGELPSDHPLSAMAGPAAKGDGREASQAVLDEFLAADVVVIGAPMYNFTIPSQLKAWVDRVLVPGRTFQYGPDGVRGLAGGKRVITVISRGGFYGAETPAAAAEHVETYLRSVLAFIGVTNPEIIIAEGVQRGPEQRSKALSGALLAASDLRAA